jgi:hypothetical protein
VLNTGVVQSTVTTHSHDTMLITAYTHKAGGVSADQIATASLVITTGALHIHAHSTGLTGV